MKRRYKMKIKSDLFRHNNILFLSLRWISVILIIIAMTGMTDQFNFFVRVFLFVVYLYGSALLIKEKNYLFLLIYLYVLIVYNPIFPFRLHGEFWRIINILTIIAIAMTIAYNKEISAKEEDNQE
jgi:hypothetical protein